MPFVVLGGLMLLTVPANYFLLPEKDGKTIIDLKYLYKSITKIIMQCQSRRMIDPVSITG